MKKRCWMTVLMFCLLPISIEAETLSVKVNMNNNIINESVFVIQEADKTYASTDLLKEIGLIVDYNPDGKYLCIDRQQMDKPLYFKLDKNTLHVNRDYVGKEPLKNVGDKLYIPLKVLEQHYNYKISLEDDRLLIHNDGGSLINKPLSEPNETLEDNKNIYTDAYLQNLVETTPCSQEVLKFRSASNSRRNGLLKWEGKYFDMYYPNTEYGQSVAEFLAPHMDKVYAMLTNLYGIQAKVEVHLIDENNTNGLREGDVRAKENVTFIWLEKNNDQDGNNLSEFVHEVNHNFFHQANGGSTNIMWINEANAKLIPSLYIKHNYIGKVDMHSFYELERVYRNVWSNMKQSKQDLNFREVDSYLKQARAWNREDKLSKKGIAQDYGLAFWNYVYNTSDLEVFKGYIRNLGTKDVIPALEKNMKKSMQQIEEEFRNYQVENTQIKGV